MAFKDIFVQNQWNSSPVAYWTIKYEHERNGVDMKYRFNWKVWLKNSGGWFYNGLKLKLFLNGSEKAITVKGYNSSQKGWSYEGTTDWYTVSNKTSGTTPFYAQLYDTNDNAAEKTSSTYSLDISPSAATTTSVSEWFSFEDGHNPTITFTNPAGYPVLPYINFYDSNGNVVHTIAKSRGNYSSPYTFTITEAELDNLWESCNKANEYVAWVGVETLIGEAKIYSSLKSKFEIRRQAPSYHPNLFTYADTNEATKKVTDDSQIIVQGKSSLSVYLQPSKANKGATIARYDVAIVKPAGEETREQRLMAKYSSNQDGGTVEFGAIGVAGRLIIRVGVVDSSGNSSTAEKEFYVYPYEKPTLSKHTQYGEITCTRCDANGVIDKSGEYLKVIIQGGWHHVNEKNTATVYVQTTTNGKESPWIPIPNTEIGESSNLVSHWSNINTKVDGIVIDTAKSYVVAIQCIDEFGEYAELPYKIPTVDVCFHLGRKGNKAAFGKYAEYDRVLELAENWDLMLKGQVVNDFIVEQGTSGNWTYEKRNSGIAKCYGYFLVSNMSCSNPWGTVYCTDKITLPSFPFVFKSEADVHISWKSSQSALLDGISNQTESECGNTYLIRPDDKTALTGKIAITAIGRWK